MSDNPKPCAVCEDAAKILLDHYWDSLAGSPVLQLHIGYVAERIRQSCRHAPAGELVTELAECRKDAETMARAIIELEYQMTDQQRFRYQAAIVEARLRQAALTEQGGERGRGAD